MSDFMSYIGGTAGKGGLMDTTEDAAIQARPESVDDHLLGDAGEAGDFGHGIALETGQTLPGGAQNAGGDRIGGIRGT